MPILPRLPALARAACFALLLLGALASAQAASLVVQGTVVDSGEQPQPLPGVRVLLERAGVEGTTDAAGAFRLELPAAPAPAPDGAVELIRLSLDGKLDRLIRVTSADALAEPITAKMERSPAGADTVGFVTLMPSTAAFIEPIMRIKPEPPEALTREQVREALDAVAEKSRAAVADGEASFHAWAPKGTGPLRAVFMVSLHGSGTIDHPVLRRFAERNNVALVGVLGDPIQRGCHPVSLMDPHIERLGELLGRPELPTLPILTFGHSNGTGFATCIAIDRPDRLIGWVSYHSGWGWQLLLPNVEQAPGLIMLGQLDKYADHLQAEAFNELRSRHRAPLAMMIEGNVDHAPIDHEATWEFVAAFCEAAMRARLGEDGTLRPVDLRQGWVGDVYDRTVGGQQDLRIAPLASYDGDDSPYSWLPDEPFARTWQEYGKTDPRK